MNSIADLFGLAIIASMFGWGNGGFGGGFGGGNNAAGFLSNQLNNDSGRELIMNAINSNGEASRAAIQNLATTLGQDYNTVFAAVQNVQNSLAQVAAQQGMSTLQVVNAIQSGNCQLGQQLAQCCCENRLLTTQQGYEAQIRTLEQTNQLGAQADRNSIIVISHASSSEQMFDTIVHEIKHLTEHISNYYGIDPKEELAAYLQGEVGRNMWCAASMVLCPICNK